MMNRHARLFLTLAVAAVLMVSSAAVLHSAPQSNAKKVNLNTATQAELETLKGIGPALAQKIIAARPFKTVADLKNVSGISQATYDEIKGLVTVRAPRATTTAQPAETAPVPKTKTTSRAAETASAAAAGLVNLNTASKAALENLPGVGAATAANIVAARPFKSVDDLKNVKGIGEAKFDKLKGLVTVEGPKALHRAEGQTSPKTRAAAEGGKQAVGGPVDLNTADKAALEALPGVGPAVADRIIAARPFKSVDDLKNVKGIGDARFAAIKDMVVVGEEEVVAHPKLQPGQTININTASQDQLESLLGVGPVKAQAIIAGRPYAKIEDIMKVRGIKEKTFAKIKDYIVVK
jgi:competence protein ComEA